MFLSSRGAGKSADVGVEGQGFSLWQAVICLREGTQCTIQMWVWSGSCARVRSPHLDGTNALGVTSPPGGSGHRGR